ncbi:sugar transferase [Geodermatophilus sp. FMUSA9-8]|uniref:sugar transferase n=1 Tax=Geodermatophilus sp. FMUSA9-8 TaxID=3120155 RepID=UPI003008B5C9
MNGARFTMLKFRSMVVDADRQVEALQAQNTSDGLLFKMRTDSRVTRVGRWLRRLSLDELPQLLNVLGGSMSLVGPRPPLPHEVAGYGSSVSRRLLVRPGLTGLWQISGRSDLSWEESVRLDLRHVQNWLLALDALIVAKTFRAVLSRSGAYWSAIASWSQSCGRLWNAAVGGGVQRTLTRRAMTSVPFDEPRRLEIGVAITSLQQVLEP